MPRKKLSEDEKKVKFEFWIEGKYLKGQNKDELRAVAHKSVVEYVKSSEKENNVLNQGK